MLVGTVHVAQVGVDQVNESIQVLGSNLFARILISVTFNRYHLLIWHIPLRCLAQSNRYTG